MRVVCNANSGSSLSMNHMAIGYTSSSKFDLEVGKEYVVYAINLWKRLLGYLIVGEGMYPCWYPARLFSISRGELPPCWHFARFNEEDGFDVNAIWGYEELVNSQEHFDALSNLEKNAIDIFLTRKKEIDEFS